MLMVTSQNHERSGGSHVTVGGVIPDIAVAGEGRVLGAIE